MVVPSAVQDNNKKNEIMKKVFLLALMAVLALGVNAQTDEELERQRQEIIKFHECFFNKISLPKSHDDTITLSSGKTIKTLAQSDFERSAFVSVDKLLEDVRLWKMSPYLWRMNHSKNNSAVMDGKDLKKWQIDSFNEIAESYFKNSTSTYHIAAHGLVSENGLSSNEILIDGQTLDAAETAEFIILSMHKTFHHVIKAEKQPFVVVVHSCTAAQGEDNFSSRLSKELAKYIPNVSVVGAPDVVLATMTEDKKYSEMVVPDSQKYSENPQRLKWKVYRNGKNTSQGQYDYLKTVSVIQKEAEGE